MNAQHEQTDVVIIGGGLAGLSAACYLARGGVAVTLFEKAAGLGGRAATDAAAGYYINRGIHALYTGGAASAVLHELARSYTYGRPQASFALYQGELHPLPADPITLLRSDLLDAGDKLAFLRLFIGLPRLKAPALARVSVADWLAQTIRRPQVRRIMAALARTFVYSAALDLVSAEVFVDKLQRSLKHPVHYIDGGWQTLVEGLRHAAEQAGTRIVRGTRVAAVEQDAGRACGVRLRDGRVVAAAAVIIATNPADAAHLLDDGGDSVLRETIARLVPAQLACLDVALHRLPAVRYPVVQDLERPCFLSTQSLYSRVAPPDGALVYAFKQLDPRQVSDPSADERDLEALLDAALPGWRGREVKRAYLPRIAAVGALPTARDGGFAGRPGPQVPGLAHLYLAGDWIGAEGFLADASFASARLVAHGLLRGGLAAARADAPGLAVGAGR
jgi:phytoene dehydrogenase-like protein